MKFVLLFFNLVFNLTLIYGSKAPIVEIDNGKLLGLTQPNYYSFYGIPYAEPPIGDLRFESPKPYNQVWENIRDARKPPTTCVQWFMFNLDGDELLGNENCLFINIHTPDYEAKELYPVIFYIHGGGYIFGSGNVETEKYLMRDPKTIYVTFNYRLGQLGFLSTGDDQISGNMGLKDQHLALKWVKANIQKFGGDPNRILMTGFSAGAASVDLQLLKPETEKLVQAAVSFSGTSLSVWSLSEQPEKNAFKLAKLLNCPTESTKKIKKCLKKTPAIDMMKQLKEFNNFLDVSVGVFAPVVESKSASDPFITETPRTLITQGKVANVPWLASFAAQDGAFFTGRLLNLIQNNAPKNHLYNFESFEKNESHSDKFHENFVAELKQGDHKKATKYFTEHTFKGEVIETLDLKRKYAKASTYSYVYDNPPDLGLANAMSNRMDINFGTCHGDDALLILQSELREMFPIREDEKLISKKLIKMLEDFIVKGKPIYDNIELPENKHGSDQVQYLKIQKDKAKIKSFKVTDKKIKTEL